MNQAAAAAAAASAAAGSTPAHAVGQQPLQAIHKMNLTHLNEEGNRTERKEKQRFYRRPLFFFFGYRSNVLFGAGMRRVPVVFSFYRYFYCYLFHVSFRAELSAVLYIDATSLFKDMKLT